MLKIMKKIAIIKKLINEIISCGFNLELKIIK